MPGITKNLLGRTFGRLEVIGPAEWAVKKRGDKTERAARWTVQCSCNGKVFPVAASALLSEQTKSCGCLKADLARERMLKHGHSKGSVQQGMPEYAAWTSMKQRCENPNNCNYKFYGARGIKVCERWQSYENFYADMGPMPEPGLTLERPQVNADYGPGNGVWATELQQKRNTRRTVFVEYEGRRIALTEAAELSGIPANTIHSRKKRGWPQELWFAPLGTAPNEDRRTRKAWETRRAKYGPTGHNREAASEAVSPIAPEASGSDPRAIADLLSSAERNALLWLPQDAAWRGGAPHGMGQVFGRLSLRGVPLAERSERRPYRKDRDYRLTPAGLRVRALLDAPAFAPATETPDADAA